MLWEQSQIVTLWRVVNQGFLDHFIAWCIQLLWRVLKSLLFGVCLAAGNWEVCILTMCRQELKCCYSLGDKRVLGGHEGSLMEVLSSVAG